MKIRKLKLKVALAKIEKENQCFFIYHSSGLSNAQWRLLKNLLYKTEIRSQFNSSHVQLNSLSELKLKFTSTSGPNCIFFFTQPFSNEIIHQKCFEMFKILESLNFTPNLVLLYGCFRNSTILNHMDATYLYKNLEVSSVYYQLLTCLESPFQNFENTLSQNVNNFFQIQDNRKT